MKAIFRLKIFVGTLLAALACTARSSELEWDGTSYLRVPVKVGSDTRLVMPEPFDDAWEHDEDVSATLLDAHTLIIRPRNAKVEQRLTLRGRNSGTLYLARVSSALPYTPVVVVHARRVAGPDASEPGASITALLRSMMLGAAPPGFRVEKTSRVLLDQAPYKVTAEQLWRSFDQAGVIAHIESTLPSIPIPIVPANIQIHIPQLGKLRALSANEYELGGSTKTARLYIVYGR